MALYSIISTKKDTAGWTYRIFYLAILIWIIAVAAWKLIFSPPGWGFYDWLYNYGGGFIRRGLTGELLFAITDITGISPVIIIRTVSLICFAILATYLYKRLNKLGLGWQVLLCSFTLGALAFYPADFMRRDYIELTLLLAILSLHHRMPLTAWIAVGNIIAIFGILLHEATFFFTVPALIMVTNIDVKNIFKSALAWLPAIATFLICCIFKGNAEMLDPIVSAVNTHYPGMIQANKVPEALLFIKANSSNVMSMHIDYNFTGFPHRIPIPTAAFTLFLICYIFYMAIAMPVAFARVKPETPTINRLGRIMIFQFICLIPMFSVLSCDMSRVAVYWIISSYLIFLSLSAEESDSLFKSWFYTPCDFIAGRMLKILPPSRLLVTALFLFIGVPDVGRSVHSIIKFSPAYKIFYNSILKLI